jgi:hypothetical protein
MDHIGFLVNLGAALDVRSIVHGDTCTPVALDHAGDRARVAAELVAANRTSVAHRYRRVTPREPVPTIRARPVPLATLHDIVQALQWIACYCYQSSEHPDWPASFASAYTTRLGAELVRRIVDRFPCSWDYDGPPSTAPHLTRVLI